MWIEVIHNLEALQVPDTGGRETRAVKMMFDSCHATDINLEIWADPEEEAIIWQAARVGEPEDTHAIVERHHDVVWAPVYPLRRYLVWHILAADAKAAAIDEYQDRHALR